MTDEDNKTSLYPTGICVSCLKLIYTKEPYIAGENVVCQMLCCPDCMFKILQKIKEKK